MSNVRREEPSWIRTNNPPRLLAPLGVHLPLVATRRGYVLPRFLTDRTCTSDNARLSDRPSAVKFAVRSILVDAASTIGGPERRVDLPHEERQRAHSL